MAVKSYNDRLFSRGLRGYIHLARFRWLERCIHRLGLRPERVIELGCYDGRAIEWLGSAPRAYLGLDANWEGGIDLARDKYKTHENYSFQTCHSADDIRVGSPGIFDTFISLETLEHVSPPLVEPYLERISSLLDGHVFVTVPNEKGLVFLFKYAIKKLFRIRDARAYSLRDVVHLTLGQTDKVERNEHRGFDYSSLIDLMSKYFDIIRVEGVQTRVLPPSLNVNVGIVARTRAGRKSGWSAAPAGATRSLGAEA